MLYNITMRKNETPIPTRQKKHPIALKAYETLAKSYAEMIDSKPENAYYEMPATLSLLSDVNCKDVLDAGCGPGQYTEWLVEHGAKVTAVDVSPAMVRLARERLDGRAVIKQADLGRPLTFLEDNSFDIVVSPLTLDHVECWDLPFKEFSRILREHGMLVFSIVHPCSKTIFRNKTGNYFETELVKEEWRTFGHVVTMYGFRRPLEAVVSALDNSGFTLQRLIEPRPIKEFREQDPEGYEELSKRPGFLCIRAVKK